MRPPFYARLASYALLGVPLALAVILAIVGVAGGLPPPGTTSVLVVFGVWALVLGALLRLRPLLRTVLAPTLVLMLGTLLLGAPGLGHPESFFDFATALTTTGGSLVAVVACVLGIVRRRRGSDPSARHQRRVMLGLATTFAIVVAASGFLTLTGGGTSDAGDADAVLVASSDHFSPGTLELDAGRSIDVLVQNRDAYAHTFTVDALAIDEYIPPSRSKVVRLKITKPGTYDLYCAIIGHEDMSGRLKVGS
jgi:heme/copper-type cytochrome/quinol oxidase subunit 2